ncbi:MAG TPA: 30S ribosomal protein S5 [Candidatus Dojkabacteria bacterium]|nr:30S ribosomal protein S5 [Candidatus Dojkabacteria bacterium]HQF36603.1 30S ribosomal protein S5 [Candidatus Dojkabacteria bacterium]
MDELIRNKSKNKGKREEVDTKPKFDRRVVSVRRVAKVRSGDKLLGFSTLVVVGDRKGKVGVAVRKGRDTRNAINKAGTVAEKNMFKVPMVGTTIPHEVKNNFGSAYVMLKPAPKGTGIIAGGAVRAVLEAAGIRDIVSKQIGKGNAINNAYCTFYALQKLHKVERFVKPKKIEKVEVKETAKEEVKTKAVKTKKDNIAKD